MTYTCPGRDLPPTESPACTRAGHPCPPHVSETTEVDSHYVTVYRCPCCGAFGGSIGEPKDGAA
jgi:hypothetical protein